MGHTRLVPLDRAYSVQGAGDLTRPGRWVELEPGKVTWEEGAHPCPQGCGGGHPIHRAATHAACEHGAWRFTEPGDAPVVAGEQPSADDLRARAAQLLAQAEQLDT